MVTHHQTLTASYIHPRCRCCPLCPLWEQRQEPHTGFRNVRPLFGPLGDLELSSPWVVGLAPLLRWTHPSNAMFTASSRSMDVHTRSTEVSVRPCRQPQRKTIQNVVKYLNVVNRFCFGDIPIIKTCSFSGGKKKWRVRASLSGKPVPPGGCRWV